MNQAAGQLELLREMNRSRLFEILRAERVVSRPQLTHQAGLSRTTVSALTDELVQLGFVEEVGFSSSSGGRPAALLRFKPDAAYALGACLVNGEWNTVLTDLDAQVLQRASTHVADGSPVAAVAALQKGVAAVTAHVDRGRVLPMIGVGTPGLVDANAGVVKSAVDVGWSEVPIGKMVEEQLGLRALVVNRSRVGALAELSQGAGRDVQDMIYISIGTGVAAGIVHQRQLYLGANSSAGELGHVTVTPDGPLCPCGNRGCLQQLASAPAIANLARARLRENSSSLLHDVAGQHPERITAEDVMQAADKGDALARADRR